MKTNLELATTVVNQLKKSGKTLAVAESLTGGGLGAAITEVAGSSEVFLGGITTYSDLSKTKLLEVSKKLITKHTAVSEEVAKEMAANARHGTRAFGNLCAGVVGTTRAKPRHAVCRWIEHQTVLCALLGVDGLQ